MATSILLPLGLALAVLAATSDTSPGPPRWFAQAAPPSTGPGPTEPAAPNPAAPDTTTTSAPEAPAAAPSPPPAPPVPTPAPTSVPAADPAGSWRLVHPLGTSATSDLADVAAATMSDVRVLVAAGGDADGPLVLASADDGASWRVLPRAGLPASGAARSVAADRDRVAVVVADADGSTVWELRHERWTQAVMEGDGDGRRAVSTVGLHEGVLVAAGFDPAASGFWVEQDAARLVRATARAASPVPPGGNVAFDLTSASGGLVAAGRMGDAAMRWTSTDGRNWHGVALPAPTSAAATALAAAGEVVAGYDASGGVVWRLFGSEWVLTRLPPPTDRPQAITAAAEASGAVVLLGREGSAGRCWSMPGSRGSEPAPCGHDPMSDPRHVVRSISARRGGLIAVGGVTTRTVSAGIWLRDDEVQRVQGSRAGRFAPD